MFVPSDAATGSKNLMVEPLSLQSSTALFLFSLMGLTEMPPSTNFISAPSELRQFTVAVISAERALHLIKVGLSLSAEAIKSL